MTIEEQIRAKQDAIAQLLTAKDKARFEAKLKEVQAQQKSKGRGLDYDF